MQLPEDFTRYTKELMGEALFSTLMDGLSQEPSVSIRVNLEKLEASGRKQIITESLDAGQVPWCEPGHYLRTRPNFTFDPLFHAGVYYVQEASSMFLHHVLKHILPSLPPSPLTVLDLCAAPGGKSAIARSLLPAGSMLYCNEPVRNRAQILSENMQKYGHPDVIVTNNYARDYHKGKLRFDLIIADVPCSGEGMFRKDPKTVSEWSMKNVEKCWRLQREIVSDIWGNLKQGGFLIYSTCTFNAKENEENVLWICEELGAELVEIPIEKSWNITGSLLPSHPSPLTSHPSPLPVYRFIPGKTHGEGLFMAVLRKGSHPRKKAVEDSYGRKFPPLNIIPNDFLTAMQEAGNAPRVELTYAQALSYLQRQALQLPADTPRGIVEVTFQGFPLGLCKNIGNRANNLYPQEWRIKTTHIPTDYEAILRHS